MKVKDVKVVDSDYKKMVGQKNKIVKAVIISLVAIGLVTVLFVFNGIRLNKEYERKLEKERVKYIEKVADSLVKVLNKTEAGYKVEYNYDDGIIIDFTRQDDSIFPYEDVETYYMNDEYEYVEVTEGKLFKDIDGNVTVLSNVYIGDRYCIYKDNKFECDKKYDKNSNIEKNEDDKVYAIGDKVTLSDGTTWRVIRNSGKYSEYVTLLSDSIMYNASNSTYLWNYSPSKSFKYNKDDERSIPYYLDVNYKRLFSYDGLYDARLMSINEYDNIDYEEDHDWLYNTELANWMLYDYSEEEPYFIKVYTYYYSDPSYYTYKMYSYNLDEVKYTLRPVITIRKDKIDTNNVNVPLVDNNEVVEENNTVNETL